MGKGKWRGWGRGSPGEGMGKRQGGGVGGGEELRGRRSQEDREVTLKENITKNTVGEESAADVNISNYLILNQIIKSEEISYDYRRRIGIESLRPVRSSSKRAAL